MKIVNLDAYTVNPGDLSWDWVSKYGEFEYYENTSPNEIVSRAKDADILFINKTPVDAKTLKQLPKLKYVGLQSTGFNVIDCQAAKQLGITITNIPEYSTNAVAQHTFALILELTNHVGLHNKSVHDGEWSECPHFCYWKAPLTELQSKTIGIIGYGKIGYAVAKIAQAFDMKILAFSPTPKEKRDISNIQFTDIDTILKESDNVTLHCTLNKSTENLIDEEALKKMKRNAIIINTSRGPVIDEKALSDALSKNLIAGAALDVLVDEPCREDNPLTKLENCIITPHIAWAGLETRSRLMEILEKNLTAFLSGNPINVVNK